MNNGSQRNIKHRSADDPYHRIHGTALETQLVIEHKGGCHIRRAKKDISRVTTCIGQDRRSGAQDPHQRVKEDQPQHAHARTKKQR